MTDFIAVGMVLIVIACAGALGNWMIKGQDTDEVEEAYSSQW